MSKQQSRSTPSYRLGDLSPIQRKRKFFSGPEAADLISKCTGKPCTASDLKDLVQRNIQLSIRFTERCLLPLAWVVSDTSHQVVAAKKEAHRTSPYQDKKIFLNGEEHLARGLRDLVKPCPDDWIWPMDANVELYLERSELSPLLLDRITEPGPISADELVAHPSISAPITVGFISQDADQLAGEGWGNEFFSADFLASIDQCCTDHGIDLFGSDTTLNISRLITPESLGAAQIEVGFSFNEIQAFLDKIDPVKKTNKAPAIERPMHTKSLNTWQNLTIRLARASLKDKFNETNKQQTARFLIERIEKFEKQTTIQEEKKLPSLRWVTRNLF